MPELLSVVDENNVESIQVDSVTVHTENLLHRSVHVLLLNTAGQLFCRKIGPTSPLYANYWSTSTGAHVLANQSTDAAAAESLQNLLGIKAELKYIGNVRINDGIENEISSTYIGLHNGQFTLNKDKLSDGRFFTKTELDELTKTDHVTPHLVASIELYNKTK